MIDAAQSILLQRMMRLVFRPIAASICCLLFLATGADSAQAKMAPDYAISSGHFFTQGAPAGSPAGSGFDVTDLDGIPFWTTYQTEGGLLRMGYPLSQRFVRDGLVTQIMQKAVFQWHPDRKMVEFVNVFDELHYAGRDNWLESLLVPQHVEIDETGMNLREREIGRLGLLEDSPAINTFFEHTEDPIRLFGLPTSIVVDYGPMEAIRLQRAVLQLWKVETEFAQPGDVLIANGGQLALQSGLFASKAMVPVAGPGNVQRESEPVPPTVSGKHVIVDRINYWRQKAGLPPLATSAALMQSAQNHAEYFILNGGAAHTEIPGLPGFTGVSIHDRAVAAGYPRFSWVDEDVAFDTRGSSNVDLFIGTVFHRLPLMHPSAIAVGYGISSGNGRGITVIDVGLDQNYDPEIELPVVFPADGQSDVPRLWYAYEAPNPVPGVPNPVGSPLTISFLIAQSVQWESARLIDANGYLVDVILAEGPSWRRSLGIVPRTPMEAGMIYTASVSGKVDGASFTKTWNFITLSE